MENKIVDCMAEQCPIWLSQKRQFTAMIFWPDRHIFTTSRNLSSHERCYNYFLKVLNERLKLCLNPSWHILLCNLCKNLHRQELVYILTWTSSNEEREKIFTSDVYKQWLKLEPKMASRSGPPSDFLIKKNLESLANVKVDNVIKSLYEMAESVGMGKIVRTQNLDVLNSTGQSWIQRPFLEDGRRQLENVEFPLDCILPVYRPYRHSIDVAKFFEDDCTKRNTCDCPNQNFYLNSEQFFDSKMATLKSQKQSFLLGESAIKKTFELINCRYGNEYLNQLPFEQKIKLAISPGPNISKFAILDYEENRQKLVQNLEQMKNLGSHLAQQPYQQPQPQLPTLGLSSQQKKSRSLASAALAQHYVCNTFQIPQTQEQQEHNQHLNKQLQQSSSGSFFYSESENTTSQSGQPFLRKKEETVTSSSLHQQIASNSATATATCTSLEIDDDDGDSNKLVIDTDSEDDEDEVKIVDESGKVVDFKYIGPADPTLGQPRETSTPIPSLMPPAPQMPTPSTIPSLLAIQPKPLYGSPPFLTTGFYSGKKKPASTKQRTIKNKVSKLSKAQELDIDRKLAYYKHKKFSKK